MDDVSAILLAVLLGGVAAGLLRLPPLLGFLAAGFVLYPLGVQAPPELGTVADLGVTVLLFGVGLKIDLRSLVRKEVWLTSSVHALVSTAVTAGLLGLLAVLGVGLAADGGPRAWLLIGFALSFSSTVFVVKVLEERGATQTLTGRLAIGVLVIQDLLAVVFLAVAEGKVPSPWAVLLVLLVPAAPLLRRLLGRLGHDEMLPLYGIVLALVPGYALFSALGVKGDLGALLLGMLLAGHPRSAELAKSLFSIKDLLLVGFFVSIGLAGLPTGGELVIAGALLLLLPVQAFVFVVLFYLARLRRRTAVFTSTVLTNFSEFGLIVVVALPDDLLDPGWAAPLAAAVAASFVLPSLVGDRPDQLVDVLRRWLPDRPTERLHPDDRPLDLGDAQAVVLGMGRVGSSAHRRLTVQYGLRAIGIEADGDRVAQLQAEGVHAIEGDATDPRLWEELELHHVELVLLAMPAHDNNLATLTRLRSHGFTGTVAAVTQFDDDLAEVLDEGADIGLQLYEGAGAELADRAVQRRPAE
ncbi:Predicted Kef-type K+ transport protein, K+/H+ antiporter domain [Klenkia marina]|uniref:Predicted Kef-type K+ transport protein, K+/H+ antiporter domain n=1 Tax=Klenkia marina TaxID=1960309 RepID=A0A1G4XIY7_9ACTN|nr:cation:proton antiporter family protein [Klenkia marina]SCX41130.1 Predicted Kef-type K+ transport protein, K+/H+ antiporter domain [Klenkia marina]